MTLPSSPPHGGPSSSGPGHGTPGQAAAPSGPAPRPGPGSGPGPDLGAAASFAGKALLGAPLALLGTGALYAVLLVVVIVVAFFLALLIMIAVIEAGPSTGGELTVGQTLLMLVVCFGVILVATPVGVLWQAGAARAGSVLLEGGRPSFGEALIGRGRVLLTAALVLVLTVIGSILFYLPGLIAAVLLLYAVPASARGASPLRAARESLGLARAHLGTTILGTLVVLAASYVGSLVVIGFVAAIPFTVLFQMALYERVNGRELPEPARTESEPSR